VAFLALRSETDLEQRFSRAEATTLFFETILETLDGQEPWWRLRGGLG
jgi:hypothetical protein